MSALLLHSLPVALAPVPEVAFVLQAGAVGTAVGSVVAARARRRDPRADVARITAAWSSLGSGVGVAFFAVSAMVGLLG